MPLTQVKISEDNPVVCGGWGGILFIRTSITKGYNQMHTQGWVCSNLDI